MLTVIVFCVVSVVLLARISYEGFAAHRLDRCTWNDLFKKLEAVPKVTVTQVGDEYLNPRPNQIAREPFDIWMELGGLEGVRRMRRNARILIAMADYAQNWNFTESVIVKERMRHDAKRLQAATFQISARMMLHMGQVTIPFHVYESVGTYHLMTKRLLTLYQNSHSGLYPRLAQALGAAPEPVAIQAVR